MTTPHEAWSLEGFLSLERTISPMVNAVAHDEYGACDGDKAPSPEQAPLDPD